MVPKFAKLASRQAGWVDDGDGPAKESFTTLMRIRAMHT